MTASPTMTSVPDSILAHFLAADPSNADRIYRAVELVSHVERSNCPGLWLVRSGNPTTPDTAYHVSNGCCDCPDTARVGAQNCKHALAVKMVRDIERADADREQADPRWGVPCAFCGFYRHEHHDLEETWEQHQAAAQRRTAAPPPPVACPVCGARCRSGQQFCSVDHEKWYWADPIIRATPIHTAAPARLTTLPAPTQCPRCHQEPAILSHVDWLGAGCLSRELFGDA